MAGQKLGGTGALEVEPEESVLDAQAFSPPAVKLLIATQHRSIQASGVVPLWKGSA